MKIVITGGHMAPALALMHVLPKEVEVVFVGRKNVFEGDSGVSLEYQTVTSMGITFIPLTTGRLQRSLTKQTIPSLLKMPGGLLQATRMLMREKPDVVVGFGGYLSVPVCVAAYFLKIPFVIHEQTLGVGIANKFLSRFATAVCISWEESKSYFKRPVILTGNPIMPSKPTKDFKTLFPVSEKDLPLLVIAGGSGGSHAINLFVEGTLEELLEKYKIIHQTGDAKKFGDFDRLTQRKNSLPKRLQERYSLVQFIHPDNIAGVFQKADLVISRAGINTVTTLLLLQKLCLLIPLPDGQQDEQLKNALLLEKQGLGMVMEQHLLTSRGLYAVVTAMMEKKEKYKAKDIHALVQLHKHAAKRIMDVIYLCTKTQYKKEKLATYSLS